MTIDHDAISRAQAAIENGLIEALQSQAQADMDGTTVIVSRQACDEAAEFLPALHDEVMRLRADLRHVIDERDATFALMLARVEAQEALLREAMAALHQYISDMRYPPERDSRDRRIAWARATLAKLRAHLGETE